MTYFAAVFGQTTFKYTHTHTNKLLHDLLKFY